MKSRCRLCADEKALNEIECTIKDQRTNIRQMLLDCCQWTTFEGSEYANLPHIVCKTCFSSLQQSWQFANNVVNAQQRLLDSFKNTVSEQGEMELQPWLDDGAPCVAFDFKMDIGYNESNDDDGNANDQFNADNDYMDDNYANENYDRDSSSEENDQNDFNLQENEKPAVRIEATETKEFALPSVETGPKYNLMDHILPEECNADGTINPAAIERLQLPNWSIVQYHCYICKAISTSSMELRQHMNEEHPHDEVRFACIFCTRSSGQSKRFPDHVRNRHLRYLIHW